MQHVFIIGSRGLPAKYGGFETFVEKLVEKFQDWKVEESWEVEFLASQVSTNPFKHI